MITREIKESEKNQYNQLVNHPLQAWEWGEFRQKMGQEIIRLGIFDGQKITAGYQITLSRLPKIPYTVGSLLRGPMPDELMINSLKKIGQEKGAIFIKMEPFVGGPIEENLKGFSSINEFLLKHHCLSGKPLFPKHTFWLNLDKSDDQLLAKMHPKTRYNLRLAQKYGVTVKEDNSPSAFQTFLTLHFETCRREGFYSHSPEYHQKMWETLRPDERRGSGQALTAHLLIAKYQKKPLVAWILFKFQQTLYYPYGGSTREFKEVMPSYAMMWQAIKLGQNLGCQKFDLWGTPGPNPTPKDPWFGFHHFKQGFGPQLVEFVGSYDLIINPPLYRLYNVADKIRWAFLKSQAKTSSLLETVKQYVSQYSPVS